MTAKKPDHEEIKRELLKKLDQIDLTSLTELGGCTRDGKGPDDPADEEVVGWQQWYVCAVWRTG